MFKGRLKNMDWRAERVLTRIQRYVEVVVVEETSKPEHLCDI